TLIPNAAEAAMVAEVRSSDAAGASFSAIARDLNARGILTKRGRKCVDTAAAPNKTWSRYRCQSVRGTGSVRAEDRNVWTKRLSFVEAVGGSCSCRPWQGSHSWSGGS